MNPVRFGEPGFSELEEEKFLEEQGRQYDRPAVGTIDRMMDPATIKDGDRFIFHGTIFEVRYMDNSRDACLQTDMIPAVEISRPGSSHLWKPSISQVQYFNRATIRSCEAVL